MMPFSLIIRGNSILNNFKLELNKFASLILSVQVQSCLYKFDLAYTILILSIQILSCLNMMKYYQILLYYRVFHVSLTFLIWLKMTLKCIVDTKARHFYNPEDPPFDMKHQLKSADSLPVVKIDLRTKVYFHSFFFHFYRI